jgi:hypothetical protein
MASAPARQMERIRGFHSFRAYRTKEVIKCAGQNSNEVRSERAENQKAGSPGTPRRMHPSWFGMSGGCRCIVPGFSPTRWRSFRRWMGGTETTSRNSSTESRGIHKLTSVAHANATPRPSAYSRFTGKRGTKNLQEQACRYCRRPTRWLRT